MRMTWDETWIDLAGVIARRSRCDRAQIGAVIVDRTNRVLATAYNGPPAGFKPANIDPDSTCEAWCNRCLTGPTEWTATSYADCPANHAEINALLVTDRSQREGGTVFVTGSVCLTCAKAIGNSGLARVVVVESGEEHRQPDRSIKYLEDCGLEVLSCPSAETVTSRSTGLLAETRGSTTNHE